MLLEANLRIPRRFEPESVTEFIGLRLAMKLNDLERLNFYLRTCANLSSEQLRSILASAESFPSAASFADFFLCDSHH